MRRNFLLVVNGVAASKFGPGNYRVESLNDPSRVAVWASPSMSGVPHGSSMSRKSMARLQAYTERRFGLE